MSAARLIVTRPLAQALPWVSGLQALGVDAQALPLITIAPLADPAPVRQAWLRLTDFALVVFVSANAVQHFFAQRPDAALWPAAVLAGSTGPGTSAALRQAGVPEVALVEPAHDAPTSDSEALWARLKHRPWVGRRALVVRGEEGRDWLAEHLRGQGAKIEFLAAYRRQPPQPDAAERALLSAALAEPARHLWHFSSSEGVAHLRGLAPQADWSRSAALASHPRIAQAARAAGFGQVDLVGARIAAVAARALAGASIQSSSL
ncbi:MAG: uroporphyrinogen-III synthase [Rubrivivax sp.]|nr:uroporphyrinogen-III synthase [Rubrivivax sp.]